VGIQQHQQEQHEKRNCGKAASGLQQQVVVAVAARVGRANITRVVGTVELMIIMMARLKNHLRDEDTYEQ
jgi:translation initiation factor 1 (eIF-1/SUI1)